MEPLAVSPDDARLALRVGTTKLYELIAARELETFKIDRRRLVRADSIRTLMNGVA